METTSEQRNMGAGDMIVFAGVAVALMALVLMLIHGDTGWLKAATIVLLAATVPVVIAQILSLVDAKWHYVCYGWAAVVGVMAVGGVSPFGISSIPKGIDFFLLLGAILVAAGSYAAQKNISLPAAAKPQKPQAEEGVEQQMAKLKDMLDKGLLTEEEYNAKRQQLLDKM